MDVKKDENFTVPDLTTIYPILNENVSLHCYPPNKHIVLYGLRRDFASPGVIKVLSWCDGTKSVFNILKLVVEKGKETDKTEQEQIFTFLTFSEKKGQISLSTKKSKVKKTIQITGSFTGYYPHHLSIELTHKCNLKCKQCYVEAGPHEKSQYISTEKLLLILDNLYTNGLRIIELTGGEPLLHPDFFKIFNYCMSKFPGVAVLTNGTLITEKDAKTFGKVKDKIQMNISLDGSTPDIHDKIRGVSGSHKKAVHAIELLEKQGLNVRISMTVLPENAHDVEQTLLLAEKSGATSFTFSPPLPFGRSKDYNEEQNLCYEKDHSKIREKYKEFTGTINKEMLKKMFELTTNCGAGHSQYVMSPMGIIRPCALGPEEWFLIGNIFESSVDKIFSNSLISFFENLPRPNKDKEPCNTCENKFLCGYCWVRAVNKNISEKLNCPWFEKSGIAKYLQIKK